MEQFKKLGIIEPVLKAIDEEKFDKPTEIQIKAIPLVLDGKDIIAGSATGSGKTLVFGSGIIQRAVQGKGIQALILTPTRELAEQIRAELVKFSKYKPLQVVAVYGGLSINPQIESLKTADVVVGTPGRLIDHLERRTIRLAEVRTLVIDEADRMFDMGFIDDVRKIIRHCPEDRHTMLFSATINYDVFHLAQKHMKDPVEVSVENFVDPRKLKQVYYDVTDQTKFSTLVHLLRNEKAGLVMVFCNSRKGTDFVANNLKAAGVEADSIHGGLTQDRRNSIMKKFHSKNVYVLVCTDVAARGLDIKGVSHIYNYDIPMEAKQYIHRIGRTARAGKEGKAVNLIANRDYDNFTKVLKEFQVDITKMKKPYVKMIPIRWRDPAARRGGSRGPDRRFTPRYK